MSKHKEPNGGFFAGRIADSMVERMARGSVYYGWYMVAVVFTVTMVRVGFNGHFFGIFLKPMSQEFGWTRAVTTGAVTTGTLIAAGLGIVMGRVLDRYGPRWLLVGACAILGAAFVGLSPGQRAGDVLHGLRSGPFHVPIGHPQRHVEHPGSQVVLYGVGQPPSR